MTESHILLLIGGYFCLLLLISYFTGKSDSNEDFFQAGRESPWYLVAFGMESGNQRILDAMNKRVTLEQSAAACAPGGCSVGCTPGS